MAEAKQDRGPTYTQATHETIRLLLEKGKGAPMEVWFALSTFASWSTGWCNPTWTRLMGETGLSRASIARAIARLEELGLLRRRGGTGIRSEYWLLGTRLMGETGRTDGTPPVPPVTPLPSRRRDDSGLTGETGIYNEIQGTRIKNERGDAPAAPAASTSAETGTTDELVTLSTERKLYAADSKQRRDVVESLVAEHGYDRARALLTASKGGDILKLLKWRLSASACHTGASKASEKKILPRCRNPACVDGRVVDHAVEVGPGGRTPWKPCSDCGGAGAVQTSAEAVPVRRS